MEKEAVTNSTPTMEEIREMWSRTYGKEGKPDWSHIFPYYDEDIVFLDSIQKVEGRVAFEAMCDRLAKRCKSLEMDIHHMVQTGDTIMMDWTMTMSFRIFPSKPIHGATRLTFGHHGRIVEQRDYYDLWGDIYDGIPYYKPFYRWFMRKFFG